MVSQLWNKVNYLAPISHLINTDIVEYDMKQANINILLYKGIIDENTYGHYCCLPKRQREISVGLMQRDNPWIAEELKKGFIEFKQKFFEANNIQDSEVLAIKNDAIFLINKIPKVTTFANMYFVDKHKYTSYYRLGRVECYYYFNYLSKEEYLDIKGISEYAQSLHENYLIGFLKCLFNSAQCDSMSEIISLLKDFYSDYINLKLELGYYREFNAASKFLIKPFPGSFRVFTAEHFDPKNIDYIDIKFNEALLRDLYKIYFSIYDSK